MSITVEQLANVIKQLHTMRETTPWYQPLKKFRLAVMSETVMGILQWVTEQGKQRSCGCAAHTNHYTN